MIIIECKQGTTEWHTQRLGMITASNFKAVISKGVGKSQSKTREAYLYKLLGERLTGRKEDSFLSAEMQWGIDNEDQARDTYQLITGKEVVEVGFVKHNDYVGVSPDGLIGKDGLLEIKCPKTTTQIKRVEEGVFPNEYMAQVQGQLWVTQRQWCDFVSFDPRLNGTNLDYFCIRMHKDLDYLANLHQKVELFEEELIHLVSKYC